MKRRRFFNTLTCGITGLGLANSCLPSEEKTSYQQNEIITGEVPVYRNKIKGTFSTKYKKSPNDRVVLALIGAGGWGTELILILAKLELNVFIKYVCDVDDTRGGHAIKELGKMQGKRPVRVRDMRKVFDDREVDGVVIATPQHWHGLASIWACQAGKDVYVEKNISFNIFEGQKMIEAAMKYERIIQCGTQNRSAEYAQTARNYIKSGKLGQVVTVNVMGIYNGPVPFKKKADERVPDTIDWNMWLGPAREVPYNVSRNKSWDYFWDYSEGAALANGSIHQLDLARLVLDNPGYPESVYCTGGRYLFEDGRDVPDYRTATFDFGNWVMNLQAGEFAPYMSKTPPEIRYGKGFPDWGQNSTRIEIYGTKGLMYVGRMGGGWQVYDKNRKLVAQQEGYFPLGAHLTNFIDCIRTRNKPNGDIIEGHKSAVLIHLVNMAYRSGKKQLYFSGEHEEVLNDKKARELARGSYRKGFEIPKNV